MSLSPKFTIDQSLNRGNVLRFTDTTGVYDATDNSGGYGAPNPEMDDVLATRLIFSDYPSERDASTVTELTAFKEYSTDTDFTYDSKTVLADETFIPQADVDSIPDGTTITETGRRYAYVSFLPLDTFYDFAPDELLIDEDKFPDRVYNVTYEVFVDVITTGNITEGDTFIVISDTSTDRVSYNGSSYKPGEVFIGRDGVTAFTTTGTPVVSKLNAYSTMHFSMYYHSNAYVKTLSLDLVRRRDIKNRASFRDDITYLEHDLDMVVYLTMPNSLDITGATNIIENIEKEYNRMTKYDS